MISSYGETSGFSPISGVELTQVNGGDVRIPDIYVEYQLKAVCKAITLAAAAVKAISRK